MTPGGESPGTLAAAWIVARKDLTVEWRARAAFLSAVVFVILAASIFYFAWDPTGVSALDLAPGVMWVIFTFAGLMGLNRSFGSELTDRGIDGLLMAPISRESLFLGKALANLVFVLGVQAVAIPVVVLLYNLPMGWGTAGALAGLAVLAAIGLVAVGTLFSAMSVNTRFAELLLPMIALPFFVPIVTAAAQATAHLLNGRPLAETWSWVELLLAFDLVFTAACTVAYPHTIDR